MSLVIEIIAVIALCAGLLACMSHVWLKFNEFHEMMFPEIRKYSALVCIVCTILSLSLNVASNIKIHKEIKENRDLFLSAYSDYSKYISLNVSLESNVSDQIKLLLSGSRRYGQYRATVLSIDDQLRTELNKVRNKDKQTLLDWYGSTDVNVNNVYIKSDYENLTDLDLKKQADSGGYEFELYYTDANLRKEAEEKYRNMLHDESLVKSYMTQFDTDKSFDITEKFKVNVDSDGKVIIDDKMKEFIREGDDSVDG